MQLSYLISRHKLLIIKINKFCSRKILSSSLLKSWCTSTKETGMNEQIYFICMMGCWKVVDPTHFQKFYQMTKHQNFLICSQWSSWKSTEFYWNQFCFLYTGWEIDLSCWNKPWPTGNMMNLKKCKWFATDLCMSHLSRLIWFQK